MSESSMIRRVAEKIQIHENQVLRTVELLDSEHTVPFIARYRKELTGSLDEDQIRDIQDYIRYFRNLNDRKETILKRIESLGKMTPDLESKILNTEKLQELEDLYLPFKPKRRTRALIAREKGLEPLADILWAQELEQGNIRETAGAYINSENGVEDAESALAGARDIIAEKIAENADIRQMIRKMLMSKGVVCSEGIKPEASKEFENFIEYTEPVSTIPPHRILALNRGEHEGQLRVRIDLPPEDALAAMKKKLIRNPGSIVVEQLELAVHDGYARLLFPSLQREVRKALTEKAGDHAIGIFARNLQALLLSPPMRGKTVMGIDPGY